MPGLFAPSCPARVVRHRSGHATASPAAPTPGGPSPAGPSPAAPVCAGAVTGERCGDLQKVSRRLIGGCEAAEHPPAKLIVPAMRIAAIPRAARAPPHTVLLFLRLSNVFLSTVCSSVKTPGVPAGSRSSHPQRGPTSNKKDRQKHSRRLIHQVDRDARQQCRRPDILTGQHKTGHHHIDRLTRQAAEYQIDNQRSQKRINKTEKDQTKNSISDGMKPTVFSHQPDQRAHWRRLPVQTMMTYPNRKAD